MKLRIRDWDKHFENAASRKLKRLDWVAIPTKTDGEGYTALVDHPNAAAHLGAWYAIVEAASKQTPRGNLPGGIPQDIGGICRSLGRMSRLPGGIFQDVLPRLIEIGWLEEFESNQTVRDMLAESATTSAESAITSADCGATGNYRELQGREENNPQTPAPNGADSRTRRPRKGDRTTEQIKAALGPERLVWWENFWRVYPCHDGINKGMDAFEARVKDHDLAVLVWKGAKAYAAKCAADPTIKIKFAQGWINSERWTDENIPMAPQNGNKKKDFVADVTEVMERNMREKGRPF